ncbi:hypothetical protein PybrP1_008527 [[Pythium] brassicae (nom. inval.)]|nr:hypothetical protein PybrP1_008527 [[Pythium] brassicae (nom. inval.)]
MQRVRLRAPEEDAAAAAATTPTGAWPSAQHRVLSPEETAPARRLPPLDVQAPEFIEQRLENLKRRPTWRAWLDEYVTAHPESDSGSDTESEDSAAVEEQSNRTRVQRVEIDRSPRAANAADSAGFVRTTLVSLAVVAFSPLLLLLYPCLRSRETWPLGCRSLSGLLLHAVTTLAFMVFGVALVYYAICRELPELNANAGTNVQARLREMGQAAHVCQAVALQGDRALVQEMCMPIAIDTALLLLTASLVFHSHRKWAKYALVVVAGLFALDVPTKLYDATFPAPDIALIDPSYALVDEELLVALDGQNLKPGGSVAWVAYWGCASTAPVESCEKQFHSTFDVGVVRVTFTSLDHFIPCYRDPPNPLKVQEYRCFERIRLRVKDKQSIPGWSRSVRASEPPQRIREQARAGADTGASAKEAAEHEPHSQPKPKQQPKQVKRQQSKSATKRAQKRKTKTVSVAAADGAAVQD